MASNNSSSTFSNARADEVSPGWSLTAPWEVVLGLLILLANFAMLILLLTRKALRSSFTTYLMLLFALNMLSALIYYPMEIMSQVADQWFMGTRACTLQIYNTAVVAAAQTHTHMIVTLNRIWAFVFPVSYKNHHTSKVALCIWLCMLLYVNIVNVPALVIDALYYRMEEVANGCHMDYDAQQNWSIVAQFLVFDLPTAFICGAFPLLWYHRRRRMRKLGAPTSFRLSASADHATNSVPERNQRSKRATRSFRILTMLTTSIFICWTPDLVYYTVACFTTVPYGIEYTVTDNLYNVQALLDPVLFALSLDAVRQAMARIWRKT